MYRRTLSIALHQKYLPQYTLPQITHINGELYHRKTPQKPNFRPITYLSDNEIITSRKICKGLASINIGYLRIFSLTLGLPDDGEFGNFGNNLPRFLYVIAKGLMPYGLTQHLTTSNIFVYGDNQKSLAVDPDWFYYPNGKDESILERYRNHLQMIVGRIIFFQVARLWSHN